MARASDPAEGDVVPADGDAAPVGPPTATPYGMRLREIVGLARRYHGLVAETLDLNASSLDAMDWLIREGALTPTELSARLGMSPGATTSIVKRLEDTGTRIASRTTPTDAACTSWPRRSRSSRRARGCAP